MAESHPRIMVFSLLLIQGSLSQEWRVTFSYDHICAVIGSSVAMPCSFTYPPPLTITKVFWTIKPQQNREPTDLLDISDYSGRVEYSADTYKNCTLILRKVTLADAGEYHPRILTENDKQKWLQRPGLILAVTALSVKILRPAVKGSPVKISCNNSCGLQDNTIVIWRRNGEYLPFNEGNVEMHLVNVSTEDEGFYSCALRGFEGHPSTPVKLNVMFPPRNTSASVRPSGEILEGSSVTLTCISDANPPAESYTWYKVGEFNPVGSGQQYNITNMRSEDGGQYYCEARNRYGVENSTALLMTVTERHNYVAFVIIGFLIFGIVSLSCIIHAVRRSNDEHAQRSVKRKSVSADGVGGVNQECSTQCANVSLLRPAHRGMSGDEDSQGSVVSKTAIVSGADCPRDTNEDCQTQYTTVTLPRPICSSLW